MLDRMQRGRERARIAYGNWLSILQIFCADLKQELAVRHQKQGDGSEPGIGATFTEMVT